MSDPVAATNSAEIDYATIDGSRVGAVIISQSEGSAGYDTLPNKAKAKLHSFSELSAA